MNSLPLFYQPRKKAARAAGSLLKHHIWIHSPSLAATATVSFLQAKRKWQDGSPATVYLIATKNEWWFPLNNQYEVQSWLVPLSRFHHRCPSPDHNYRWKAWRAFNAELKGTRDVREGLEMEDRLNIDVKIGGDYTEIIRLTIETKRFFLFF